MRPLVKYHRRDVGRE